MRNGGEKMEYPIFLEIKLDRDEGQIKVLDRSDNIVQVIEEIKFAGHIIIISKSDTDISIDTFEDESSQSWIMEIQ
jgi:hypothetical protein